MATSQTTIRLDPQIKQQFDDVVNKLGMSASTAYNLFVRATIQRQGLPFDLVLDPLDDPAVKANVEAALELRSARADYPGAGWLSTDELRRELGL
jgi:DNA-damage-inducible protein J